VKVRKIFGPPGTGKTTRLLGIMEAELAGGVPPERMAFLTFTVAARKEAKDRAKARFRFSDAQLKWFRTLHSVAYELLGVTSGAMVTPGQGLEAFGSLYGYEFSQGQQFSAEGLPMFGHGTGDRLLAFDHFRRHRLQGWSEAFKRWPDRDVARFEAQRFCEGYERWKGADGWVDFTDLLERGTAALPCDVVIVDEAQDLSPLQWRTLWRFAERAERVYVAGDDDQAIYEWAGADPATFLTQPADAVEVLPQSHRCPRKVTDLARRVIELARVRQPKEWAARAEDGVVAHRARVDGLDLPKEGGVLFLYRNHKYAADVTAFLRSEGEPFSIAGRPSVAPAAAEAIVAWEELRRGRAVALDGLEAVLAATSLRRVSAAGRAAARTAAGPAGAFTAAGLGWSCEAPWFAALDRLKEDEFYLRKIVQRGGRKALTEPPRIRLSTVHGAKGAEEDHVVLLTGMSRKVRQSLEVDADAERRVWYVGITRARKSLTLVGDGNPLLT
jgi:DNA helicase-2/ATP-dependent DNA helicase PcrA